MSNMPTVVRALGDQLLLLRLAALLLLAAHRTEQSHDISVA
jgi:hypothetical protein